jgi:hypothetical protein
MIGLIDRQIQQTCGKLTCHSLTPIGQTNAKDDFGITE